jgi:hypothetical protein
MHLMSNLRQISSLVAVAAVAVCSLAVAGEASKPLAEPARIEIKLSPESVPAGGKAEATLLLTPIDGVTINRYPKITLKIAAQEGLAGSAESSVGDDAAPPPEKSGGNYFDKVDPLRIELSISGSAKPGMYQIEGKLKYYYCVKKSGFCAPKKETVKIPLVVR